MPLHPLRHSHVLLRHPPHPRENAGSLLSHLELPSRQRLLLSESPLELPSPLRRPTLQQPPQRLASLSRPRSVVLPLVVPRAGETEWLHEKLPVETPRPHPRLPRRRPHQRSQSQDLRRTGRLELRVVQDGEIGRPRLVVTDRSLHGPRGLRSVRGDITYRYLGR